MTIAFKLRKFHSYSCAYFIDIRDKDKLEKVAFSLLISASLIGLFIYIDKIATTHKYATHCIFGQCLGKMSGMKLRNIRRAE